MTSSSSVQHVPNNAKISTLSEMSSTSLKSQADQQQQQQSQHQVSMMMDSHGIGSVSQLSSKTTYPMNEYNAYLASNTEVEDLGNAKVRVVDWSNMRYGGGIQLPLKRLPNQASLPLSELVWSGRTSDHQKLAPTFPWLYKCVMVTKLDFLQNSNVAVTNWEILKFKCRLRLVVYLMLLGNSRPFPWLILEENGY